MRNCRTTRPSFWACSTTPLATLSFAISTRSNVASSRHGGPAGGSGFGPRGVAWGVVLRLSRGARSSVAPLTAIAIAPSAGSVSVPCATVRPSTSRSMRNTDSRVPANSARPRSARPSPSTWIASIAVSRSRSSSSRAVALAATSRGLRHSSAPTDSSAPPRSAVTATSPWPLRRSVSTACTCAAPLMIAVASRPAAASCRASGAPVTVTLCTTWLGGPERKSIVASSFVGIDASSARPPIFMPSLVAVRSSTPCSRSCPATSAVSRTPSSFACTRIGMSSIRTVSSSGSDRLSLAVAWPAGFLRSTGWRSSSPSRGSRSSVSASGSDPAMSASIAPVWRGCCRPVMRIRPPRICSPPGEVSFWPRTRWRPAAHDDVQRIGIDDTQLGLAVVDRRHRPQPVDLQPVAIQRPAGPAEHDRGQVRRHRQAGVDMAVARHAGGDVRHQPVARAAADALGP